MTTVDVVVPPLQAGQYRIWIQVERAGKVLTGVFGPRVFDANG